MITRATPDTKHSTILMAASQRGRNSTKQFESSSTTFSYPSESKAEQRSQYSDHATGCTVRDLYPDGARNFSCLQIVRTGSGAHPISYSMRNLIVCRESIGRGLNLTNDLNLVPRLRTNGAILLLIVFVSWTRKTYPYSSTSEF